MIKEIISKRLQLAMDNIGISAQELSNKSGVAKASISQYMHGSHKPSGISSSKLSVVLDVNPLWLMGFNVSSENAQIEQQTHTINPPAEDDFINLTLGNIIKEYRTRYDLSMEAFAKRSGISKSYVSLLEKNRHPKTGKRICPSIQCIRQAAAGMNMDFDTLFNMLDKRDIMGCIDEDINSEPCTASIMKTNEILSKLLTPEEEEIIKKYHALDERGKEVIKEVLEKLYTTRP